jgi:aminoglycoside phosphotransferase (APT) family kinase protein
MDGAAMDGIDEPRVSEWLAAHVPEAEPPFSFSLIAGGRSNLTYRFTDAVGTPRVLRRPPLGHVLATAHDMGRELRIIAALGEHGSVPIPAALGFCDDSEVIGAPFSVMSFVDGVVVRDLPSAALLAPSLRPAAARDLIETLARLHEPEPEDLGLGELARREDYLARQLKRWYGQFQQMSTREIPSLDEAYRLLSASLPVQQRASVVHGDYRLDNTVLSAEDGSVRAVLDWEICTLGDPLADLGQLCVYWAQADDPVPDLLGAPTASGGFPSRDELVGWYGACSSLDLGDLDRYVAFGYWKLACILEGVYERTKAGAGGGDGSDPGAYEVQVPLLAEAALRLARQSGGGPTGGSG